MVVAAAGGSVNGILMDASVLLASEQVNLVQDRTTASLVRPGTDSILRKLRYSKIPTAIFYQQGLSALQVNLLEEMAQLNLFNALLLRSSSIENAANEASLAWGDNRPSCILLVSNHSENLSFKLRNSGWITVILRSPGQGLSDDIESASASENASIFVINKLEELPLIICHLNRKAESKENILVVGYKMKPSREEDFAKRGAFPLCPTQNGLIFLPLDYELPISSQLQQVDIVLHKGTDEIVDIEMSSTSESVNKITFANGMQELQRYFPPSCVDCYFI